MRGDASVLREVMRAQARRGPVVKRGAGFGFGPLGPSALARVSRHG